jgi:ABC-2 type transport system ATP-binding protein
MSDLAVECDDLRRVYRSRSIAGRVRETVALDGLTLDVPAGTVFGLLGPNGAGKTTTVRILSTLLVPTGGSARVLGHDVVRDTRAVRDVIGLAIGGDRGFYNRITGRQNLHYFAALSGLSRRDAKQRTVDVLELVHLSDRADEPVQGYSRGMRQRLHLARALITQPRVLFLDEPTLGIDPVMAQEFRRLVPEFARQGMTVLITTHYMLEADEICDRIAMINHGQIVAEGTPAEIKRGFGQATVTEATLRRDSPGLLDAVRGLPGVEFAELVPEGVFFKLRAFSSDGSSPLARMRELAGEENLEDVIERGRTLEEAYIAILR